MSYRLRPSSSLIGRRPQLLVLQETVTDSTGALIQDIVKAIGHDHISQTTFTPNGPAQDEAAVFHFDGHGNTRVLTSYCEMLCSATNSSGDDYGLNCRGFGCRRLEFINRLFADSGVSRHRLRLCRSAEAVKK